MSVIKVEKTNGYTVMSNVHLKDKNLSFKAKGLLSMIFSLPKDWEYSIQGLVAISKESDKAVRNTLKELELNNYLTRKRINGNNGKFEYEYTVYERPQQSKPYEHLPYTPKGHTVEGHTVEGHTVEGHALKDTQLNTKELNTKELNTKELNTKDIYNAPSNEIATEPPVIEFILNDKTYYPITQKQVDKWSELYPNVDIMQQLMKMCGWLDANPRNRKTKGGILRFVNGWLAREQDKPRKVQQQTTKDLAPNLDFNEFY